MQIPNFWEEGVRKIVQEEVIYLKDSKDNKNFTANEIHQIIDSKINASFGHTVGLLNFLLFVVTLFITIAPLAAWWIIKTTMASVLADTRHQVEAEVNKQLRQQVDEEIESQVKDLRSRIDFEFTGLFQLLQEEKDAELKSQTEEFKKEVERVKEELHLELVKVRKATQQQRDKLASKFNSEISQLQSTVSSLTDPNTSEIHQQIQEMYAAIQGLRANNPQLFFTANDYVEKGNDYFVATDYENAIASYEKAIEINPEYPEAWFYKGRALSLGQKRYEEAVIAYNQAIILKPDYCEAMVFCSVALRRVKRYDESINLCNKALDINPDYSRAWYSLACSYAMLKDTEKAIKYLGKAIQINSLRYRETAKNDSDLDSIRQDERFQQFVYG
ncbi:MAG: tetratricopeptide repeat protein [Calothrix sp. SM1_7_51]|nr:tetratricopeptide repeat protein [Calothrix sp. SM1_7_51]